MDDITEDLDLYGFKLEGHAASPAVRAVRLQCDGAAQRAERAWAPFAAARRLPDEKRLKELLRAGVPPTLRPWVWLEASGAAARRRAAAEASAAAAGGGGARSSFEALAHAGETRASARRLREIDEDARRFALQRAHAWLQSEEGVAAMRRVLLSFEAHSASLAAEGRGGDSSGAADAVTPAAFEAPPALVPVAALLLLALDRSEDSAFWVLLELSERALPSAAPPLQPSHRAGAAAGSGGQQSASRLGCEVEVRALGDLISSKLPRLAAHLGSRLEADAGCFAADWFLSLFASSLPAETAARMWDALLFEGPKVLFRVALALLSAIEERALACDSAAELALLARAAASSAHDRDALLARAFGGVGSLPMAAIEHYRAVGGRRVAAEQQGGGHSGGGSGGGDGESCASAGMARAGGGEWLAVARRSTRVLSHTTPSHAIAGAPPSELRELRERAGVLTAVAASGVKQGLGRLVHAAKKAAGRTTSG